MEKTAYTAIEREEDRLNRLQSAKNEVVIEKKRKEYETVKEQADKAIESYDRFHYLYLCLIGTLQVFDRHGNPNDRQSAETTVYAALDPTFRRSEPRFRPPVVLVFAPAG